MSFASELAACDRETGLNGSFHDFVRLAWPRVYPSSPFVDNWHIGLLCAHYEAVFRGEIRELVVNLPPGGSKSSLTCVMWPAWGWIRDPASSWIFSAYGQKLVRRDAQTTVDLMKSNWWRSRWGDRFTLPTVPAIENVVNSVTGFRLGTTPGAEATGFHANFQVFDDPNKPEELTKVGLESVRDWEARTMGSRWRRPPAVNGLVCIMQRLHCDDLAATFIDRGAVHICLPANYDPARKTVTTWGSDPRTEPGQLLDANRLPQREIDRLRRNLGPINAAAQLDQNPVPEGGAVFRKEHLRFWSTNPVRVMTGVDIGGNLCRCVDKPTHFDQRINSWDCAFKDEETSDPVCGQEWVRSGSGFYLMDQELGQFDFPETVKRILALRARKLGANLVLIEDKANGPAVVVTLQQKVSGIIAVDPRGGKFSRASSTAGYFEAGNVFLPDPNMPGFGWVGDLIAEMLSFPRARHDDQVDAMTQAILYLIENTNYLQAAMAKVREDMEGKRAQ